MDWFNDAFRCIKENKSIIIFFFYSLHEIAMFQEGLHFQYTKKWEKKTSTSLLTSGKNAEKQLVLSVHKPKLKEMVKISQCIQFRLEHQSGKDLFIRTSIIHTNPQRRASQVTVVILQCSQTESSSFQKNKTLWTVLFQMLFLSSKTLPLAILKYERETKRINKMEWCSMARCSSSDQLQEIWYTFALPSQ